MQLSVAEKGPQEIVEMPDKKTKRFLDMASVVRENTRLAFGVSPLQNLKATGITFLKGERGSAGIGFLFGILIFLLVAVAVIPIVMSSIAGADTSGWDDGSVALWSVLGVIVIAGVVYMVAKKSGILGGD